MFRGGQRLLLPNNQPHNLPWKSPAQEGMMSSGCSASPLAWWRQSSSAPGEFMEAPSSLFSLLSPPRCSLLGVGVLTCFGVHHLVRVMPGRKSSLGRLRGRAFGRESRSREGGKRGEKEGVMQRAGPLMPGDSLPGTMCPSWRRLWSSGGDLEHLG